MKNIYAKKFRGDERYEVITHNKTLDFNPHFIRVRLI